MSQDQTPYDAETFDAEKLRKDIIVQMIKGSLIASVVFFGPLIFIFVLSYLGSFLPPESKEADDPTPNSFSFYETTVESRLV